MRSLTNCTWLWECAFRNWGMMQGPLKLEAREWDNEFHCFNVLDDPDELNNLGEQACARLPDRRNTFHVMPNLLLRRRKTTGREIVHSTPHGRWKLSPAYPRSSS